MNGFATFLNDISDVANRYTVFEMTNRMWRRYHEPNLVLRILHVCYFYVKPENCCAKGTDVKGEPKLEEDTQRPVACLYRLPCSN